MYPEARELRDLDFPAAAITEHLLTRYINFSFASLVGELGSTVMIDVNARDISLGQPRYRIDVSISPLIVWPLLVPDYSESEKAVASTATAAVILHELAVGPTPEASPWSLPSDLLVACCRVCQRDIACEEAMENRSSSASLSYRPEPYSPATKEVVDGTRTKDTRDAPDTLLVVCHTPHKMFLVMKLSDTSLSFENELEAEEGYQFEKEVCHPGPRYVGGELMPFCPRYGVIYWKSRVEPTQAWKCRVVGSPE